MVIIRREREMNEIKMLGRWIYICGRRKTGKTFFVRNFMDYDVYFFVNRDGSIFTEDGRKLSYETFFELIRGYIGNKKIVIDEMHRLPSEFFDFLHSQGRKGNIIGISSTLWLSQKLLGSGSPILGLFSLYIFNLADGCDVLNSLPSKDYIEKLKAAAYLRDPILAEDYQPPIEDYLAAYLHSNRLTLKEIIGEIFTDEQRKISQVYEGILRAVAYGKRKSGEISSFLFSRKIIPKDNPGLIQRYLDVLVKIGLLEKIETMRRGYYYTHVSPLFDLHFYLDEKYGYTEMDVPIGFIKNVVMEKIPYAMEKFIWDLIAEKMGLKKVKIEVPEVDMALKRFKKLHIVGEVRWKGNVEQRDINKMAEKLKNFDAYRIIFVPDKSDFRERKGVKIIDVRDIMAICKGKVKMETLFKK